MAASPGAPGICFYIFIIGFFVGKINRYLPRQARISTLSYYRKWDVFPLRGLLKKKRTQDIAKAMKKPNWPLRDNPALFAGLLIVPP